MFEGITGLLFASLAAADPDCGALDAQGNTEGVRIPGHLAMREVIGKGRAHFYSAPSEACPTRDVFVVPRDSLIAYVEYRGFTAVMYLNPKTGVDVEGWVRTSRLRETGKGISPD